jgi:hypothetical protein
MTSEALLGGVKDRWNQLVALAVVLVTALSGFVLVPPATELQTSHLELGRFVIAGAVGLWMLPMMRWGRRRHAWRWWSAGAVLLVTTVATVLAYQSLRSRSTFPYFGERRLKGEHLQPVAQRFADSAARSGTVLSDSGLVYEAAGNNAQVWPPRELELAERRLVVRYLIALLVGASTIIVITQALFCSGAKTASGKAAR